MKTETRTKTMEHDWQWAGHGEGHHFGDPDKPYVIDFWRCARCEKVVEKRSWQDPAPGRCPGRARGF